jgi:hypothetical protein
MSRSIKNKINRILKYRHTDKLRQYEKCSKYRNSRVRLYLYGTIDHTKPAMQDRNESRRLSPPIPPKPPRRPPPPQHLKWVVSHTSTSGVCSVCMVCACPVPVPSGAVGFSSKILHFSCKTSRCRARLTLRSPPTRTRRALFGRHAAADGLRRIISSLAGYLRTPGANSILHSARMILSDVLTCTVPPLRVESSLLKNPIPPKNRICHTVSCK